MNDDWLLDYFRQHGIPEDHVLRVDRVLALLRINTAGSLALVEELLGRPITVCPPAVPPWPPKPVSNAPRAATVLRVRVPKKVQRNGQGLPAGSISAKSRKNLKSIRRGMTKGQLHAIGISERDVKRWTRTGIIAWRGEPW